MDFGFDLSIYLSGVLLHYSNSDVKKSGVKRKSIAKEEGKFEASMENKKPSARRNASSSTPEAHCIPSGTFCEFLAEDLHLLGNSRETFQFRLCIRKRHVPRAETSMTCLFLFNFCPDRDEAMMLFKIVPNFQKIDF